MIIFNEWENDKFGLLNAIDGLNLKGGEYKLASLIARSSADYRIFWNVLAKRLGTSRNTITRYKNKLVAVGFCSIETSTDYKDDIIINIKLPKTSECTKNSANAPKLNADTKTDGHIKENTIGINSKNLKENSLYISADEKKSKKAEKITEKSALKTQKDKENAAFMCFEKNKGRIKHFTMDDWGEWVAHKIAQSGSKSFTMQTWQQNLNKLIELGENAPKSIKKSIANCWVGLFEVQEPRKANNANGSARQGSSAAAKTPPNFWGDRDKEQLFIKREIIAAFNTDKITDELLSRAEVQGHFLANFGAKVGWVSAKLAFIKQTQGGDNVKNN